MVGKWVRKLDDLKLALDDLIIELKQSDKEQHRQEAEALYNVREQINDSEERLADFDVAAYLDGKE